MIGRFFVCAAFLSLVTLPVFRIAGIPLPLFLVGIAGLLLLVELNWNGVHLRKISVAPILCVVLFALAFSISAFIHNNGYRMAFELWAYVICFVVILIYLVDRNNGFIALRLLGWVSLIVSLVGMYNFVWKAEFWWVQAAREGLGTRNSDAFMMWAGLPYWLSQLGHQKGWKKILCFMVIGWLLVSISLTASRGASLITLAILLFFLFVYFGVWKTIFVSILVSTPIALCVNWRDLEDNILLVHRLQKNVVEDERFYLAKSAWEIVSDHPLLGSGYDSSHIHVALNKVHDQHFHNAFLQLWAESGILLPSLLLLIVIMPLIFSWMMHGSYGNKETRVAGTILAVGLLLEMLISVFYNWIFFWFVLSVAVALLLPAHRSLGAVS